MFASLEAASYLRFNEQSNFTPQLQHEAIKYVPLGRDAAQTPVGYNQNKLGIATSLFMNVSERLYPSFQRGEEEAVQPQVVR